MEHFADECGGVPAWLDKHTYYTAFTEGWGLYSENPILSDDTDTYKDNLLQKYGMAKWQVRKEKLYNTAVICAIVLLYLKVTTLLRKRPQPFSKTDVYVFATSYGLSQSPPFCVLMAD